MSTTEITPADFMEVDSATNEETLTEFLTGKVVRTGGFIEDHTGQPMLMIIFEDASTLVASCMDGHLIVGNGTAVEKGTLQ